MTPVTIRALASFVGMQLGWFACVLGAARGRPWLGPVVVLVALSVHVARQPSRGREALVLGGAALLGFVVDTALIHTGVLHMECVVAPPWLVALWPNFAAATARGGLLDALRARPFLGAVVGALGGALAYDAGARLGPIALDAPRLVALGIIALVWSAVLPSLFALRARCGT